MHINHFRNYLKNKFNFKSDVVYESTQILIENDTPISRNEILINFIRSVERFRFASEENIKPGDNLKYESLGWSALGEAFYWLYSFFEKVQRANDLTYKNFQLVGAFKALRNYAQHENRYFIATSLQINQHGQQNSWIWASPPSNIRSGDEHRFDTYVEHLMGQKVIDTLDRLIEDLWDLRGWEIKKSDVEQPGYTCKANLPFDSN